MIYEAMRRHCSTSLLTSKQIWRQRRYGDTLSDAQALVETLADSVAEVEDETPGDTRGEAQPPVDKRVSSLAEVEEETLG